MKILIADDQPTNLKLLRAQLEAEGVTVREAGDGRQALAVLEREPVDAVISDVLMPNMDGFQLCHTLRETARFKTIPCILYSNTFTSESNRELGILSGADLYLKKPASAPTILAAIAEIIRQGDRNAREWGPAIQAFKATQSSGEYLSKELEWQKAEMEEIKRTLLGVNHTLLLRTKQLKKLEAKFLKTNRELEWRIRERTLELEAANKELESFSYSVSHDLHAPSRAINGFGRVVLEKSGQLEPDGNQSIRRVMAATGETTQLIDALRSLAHVTRADIRRRRINVSAIAQTVLGELQQASPDRSIEIVIQPDLKARADARLIRIVLTNLLGNAWKFTGKTACPRIELGAHESGGQRHYFVRDNGAGFDMAHAGELFGAFRRLHSAAEFQGTGIGLAIVQRIIRRHGGRVWGESALQQGATFYFTLGEDESEPGNS